jgi:hypothetical protein
MPTKSNSLHDNFREAHTAWLGAVENVESMKAVLVDMRDNLADVQAALLKRQDAVALATSKALISKQEKSLCVVCGASLGKSSWPVCMTCAGTSRDAVDRVSLAQAGVSGTGRNLELAKAETEKLRLVEIKAFEGWIQGEWEIEKETFAGLLEKSYRSAARLDALAFEANARGQRDYGMSTRGGPKLPFGLPGFIRAAIIRLGNPQEEKENRKIWDGILAEAKIKIASECWEKMPGGERAPVDYSKLPRAVLPRMRGEHLTGGKTIMELESE